jgi:hypothetical protein
MRPNVEQDGKAVIVVIEVTGPAPAMTKTRGSGGGLVMQIRAGGWANCNSLGISPITAHIWAMVILDRWMEKFKCPDCGKIGTANLIRTDGHEVALAHGEYLIRVDSLPDDFKVVGDPQDIDVFCVKCNVSAWP